MLTKLHSNDTKIEASVAIRFLVPRGQLPELKIHMRNADDEPWQLEAASTVSVKRSIGKGMKQTNWTLKFSPGMPQEVFVTLRGRVVRDLPVVEIDGAVLRGHWLAWRCRNPWTAWGEADHQSNVGSGTNSHRFWPIRGSANLRCGTARISQRASGRVAPSYRANGRNIVAATEEAWLTEDEDWLHKASLWVQADERTDLRFHFPAPVESLSAWTGDQMQSVSQSTRSDYGLTLGAKSTGHALKLRWKYLNRTDDPNLANMQLDEGALLTRERLVWIPKGMVLANADSPLAPTYPVKLLQDAAAYGDRRGPCSGG